MLMRVGISLCRQVNKATPDSPCRVGSQRILVRAARVLVVAVCALALIAIGGSRTNAQAQSLEEHDAKAAFMLKLVNFVQWPGDAGSHDLVIGFIGADATSEALQRMASGKLVNGRGIVIRRLGRDGDLKACKVIFVGASERKNTSSVLESLRGTSVLTVGESDGFGQHGGIVNVLLNDGRIRFEVNPHAAERAHLQISSRLLSLATIVADGS
jgi:YfiR/HmsC-like